MCANSSAAPDHINATNNAVLELAFRQYTYYTCPLHTIPPLPPAQHDNNLQEAIMLSHNNQKARQHQQEEKKALLLGLEILNPNLHQHCVAH